MSKIKNTKYIFSTSGRKSSLKRYQTLLEKILKVDIEYVSFSNPKEKVDPEEFAKTIKRPSAIGGAISRDIKNSIIPYLDQLDKPARKVQSVNTVINKNGKLIGYNTDLYGFGQAIKGIKEPIKTAIVYGYGGIFNNVYYVLKSLGIDIYVTGRRIEEAKKRAKEFDINIYDNKPKDLFINATPLGNEPLDKDSLFLKIIKNCKVVFDHQMPGKYTRLFCEKNNVSYIPGTEMYYPQMHRQWELFLEGLVVKDKIPSLIAKAEKRCHDS